MKRTWKQIGSLFMAVCMVLTMLPMTAFAETEVRDAGTPLGLTAGEINITAQPTPTLTAEYGDSARTISVTASTTNDAPITYQWYRELEGGVTMSDQNDNQFTFSIRSDLNPGTHKFYCELKAEGCAKVTSDKTVVTVNKAVYTGKQSDTVFVKADQITSSTAYTLPDLPGSDMSYEIVTEGSAGTLIKNSSVDRDPLKPWIRVLTFDTSSQPADTEESVSLKINGGYFYEDSTFTLTVKTVDKFSAKITGVTGTDEEYSGVPQKGYTGTPDTGAYNGALQASYKGRNTTAYSSATPPTDAGDYTVTLSIPASADYSGSLDIDFSIRTKEITVKPVDYFIVSGDPLSFIDILWINYSGFVGSDTVDNSIDQKAEAKLTVNDSNTPGTSEIIFEKEARLKPEKKKNYVLKHENGKLTIQAAHSVTGTMDIGGQTGVSLALDQAGTGWEWDAATATLTLDSGYLSSNIIKIQCGSSDNINLVLTGDVTIRTGSSFVLCCYGNLNIKAGDYTLDLSSTTYWCALSADGNLVVESGTVIATGADETNAIQVTGNVTISGSANVTATSSGGSGFFGASGIKSNGDVFINTRGEVHTSGHKNGIYAEGGITISNGTVTAVGADPAALIGASSGVTVTGGTLATNSSGGANGDVVGGLTVNGAATKVTVNGNIKHELDWLDNTTIISPGDLTVSGGTVTVTGTVAGKTTVTDGTVSVNGTIIPPSGTAPSITTTDLLSGTVWVAYSQTLAATGTEPVTWSIAGGTLPSGLTLNEDTGLISGIPAMEGLYAFNVRAQNDAGSIDRDFFIQIYSVGTAVYSVTFDLNGGTRTGGGELTQEVPKGSAATAPTVTRSNYTFTGWDKAFTNVTSNLTVKANWSYNGSDGGNGSGSGGSSGGSSDGTATTTTTMPEKSPDQPVTAAAPVTATAGTNGAASASIPEKSIIDAIAKAQAGAKAQGKTANGTTVELNVTMPGGATSLTANLTRNSLNSLVSTGVTSLELNGSPVAVSFDQKALAEIQKQSTGNISITIVPNASLSDSAKAIIGTRPVYELTVNYTKDGKNATVSSFGGGTATVSVPYILGKNEAVGGLYAVYVDGAGNATRIAGSAYDANSGCVIFTTRHFSLYGVGYTAPSAKFTDIGTHWGKEAIDYVVGRGLLSGTSDTTFAPATAMTRGILVTALGRLAGVDIKAYTTGSFTDVKLGSASQSYIEWAYKKGIVQGIGNQQFAPDRAITREEIAVIFANYAKATGYKLPVTREATAYADASGIGSVYKDAVTTMQQAGIMMGGAGNKFSPKASATRAEVSSMLHRYIKLTIEPDTAQGWTKNDAGLCLYYKDGKALTGTQTIDGVKYFFNTDGTLKTGWVKDGDNWRYYFGNKTAMGWLDISGKRYYFTQDGIMVSGKWLEIDGKRYYFYTDGSLAKPGV